MFDLDETTIRREYLRRIEALEAENALLRKAARDAVSCAERHMCTHDETHRGGFLWEICDHCGARWADDEGGKPDFEWPEELVRARALLNKETP